MKVLHLFAGAGGSHLAGEMLGWRSVGSVEIEPYCQAVIRNHYPEEVIHGDITTFSAAHLRGSVDGICGGFPCQDISSAGKGAGITGEKSGLWKEFARVIGECRPAWAFIENSPLLRSRGMGVVLRDLASFGYDAEWSTYRASDVGAPHRRDRMWVLAYSPQLLSDVCGTDGREVPEFGDGSFPQDVADTDKGRDDIDGSDTAASPHMRNGGGGGSDEWSPGCGSQNVAADDKTHSEGISEQPGGVPAQIPNADSNGSWWASDPADLPEPSLGRVVNGVANRLLRWNRVHAVAALGNGWVPQQAAEAFRQLMARAMKETI